MSVTTHTLTGNDNVAAVALRAMLSAGPRINFAPADRPAYDAIIERSSAPDGVSFEEGRVGGVPGWWARPQGAPPKSVVLYLHGGGFVLGSAKAYRGFVGQIAMRADAPVFIADYALAPENPFPAAWDDLASLQEGLVQLGYERIALAGDSAGGGLALSALSHRSRASDRIVGIVALSPWIDLALSGASIRDGAASDPILQPDGLAQAAEVFLSGASANDPRLDLLHSRFVIKPPVQVHTGEAEILLDDSTRFAEAAEAQALPCNVNIWDGMFHVFPTAFQMFEASAEALDQVGAFLKGVLTPVRKKRVVVLGAAGGTGRAIVGQLHALGHNVVAVVRTPDKAQDLQATLIEGDASDVAVLERALARADAVISGHAGQPLP